MSVTQFSVAKVEETARAAAATIAPVFQAQGWTWWDTYPNVPNEDQIYDKFMELFFSYDEGDVGLSTGRLSLDFYPNDVAFSLRLGSVFAGE